MDPITLTTLIAVAGFDSALLLAIRIGRVIRNSPKRRLRRKANDAKRAIDQASRAYVQQANHELRRQLRRKHR